MNDSHPQQRLLTYPEAGDLLGVTERTIFNLVKRGAIPAVRVGRLVRIDPTDLQRFVERSKQGAAPDPDRRGVSDDVA